MRKSISTFLVAVFFMASIFNASILTKKAEGAEVLFIAKVILIGETLRAVGDGLTKWSKQVNKSKSGTTTTYTPNPGYGDADRYWKFNDVVDHFEEFNDQYSFITTNKPSEAYACLPENFINKANQDYSNIAVCSLKAQSSASIPIQFPWIEQKSKLRKGDIVFTRANTTFSEAAQYFTSWVHAGVIYDVGREESFESFMSHGVKIYHPRRDWPEGYSWSVKRAKNLTASKIASAVDTAKFHYEGKPYLPEYFSSHRFRQDFVAEWADRDNSSSFYCTKLVWKIYDFAGIDIDSNRTSALVGSNFNSGKTDMGDENAGAWIGVSGDDIYYSKHLSSDIYVYGTDNLTKPLPGWLIM